MLSWKKWVNTGAGSLVHTEWDLSAHPQTVGSSSESGGLVWGPPKAWGGDALRPVIQTRGWGLQALSGCLSLQNERLLEHTIICGHVAVFKGSAPSGPLQTRG